LSIGHGRVRRGKAIAPACRLGLRASEPDGTSTRRDGSRPRNDHRRFGGVYLSTSTLPGEQRSVAARVPDRSVTASPDGFGNAALTAPGKTLNRGDTSRATAACVCQPTNERDVPDARNNFPTAGWRHRPATRPRRRRHRALHYRRRGRLGKGTLSQWAAMD
jgi:hypothetical protein